MAICVAASAAGTCTSPLPAVSVAVQMKRYVLPRSPVNVALASRVSGREGVKPPSSTETKML
jgi:hypothetical protein